MIRRHLGEQLLPQCTVGHTQAGSGGIMLWGMFSWATLGPVVEVQQTMNATGYMKMIADQLNPYMAYVKSLKLCWSGSMNMVLNFS
ncbi:transposase domain containing protein [Trichonephila clavipes]|nr:transposase domain containing protein [Trichonephila clavipes]